MSNELSAQELLPPEIGLTLLGFEKSEQGWLVRVEGRARSECPSCGTQSTARHSTSDFTVQIGFKEFFRRSKAPSHESGRLEEVPQ
jgi:hypothetical protein